MPHLYKAQQNIYNFFNIYFYGHPYMPHAVSWIVVGPWCYNGASAILDTFLGSDFCLQPRGDTYTRRSVFDCIVASSIPVFF